MRKRCNFNLCANGGGLVMTGSDGLSSGKKTAKTLVEEERSHEWPE